ncbi:Glutamyl-tRNA(Gln) amidotransferase subunit B, mitochondrial [Cytospora mali]|uniref:Glutamyl-tRNA(Gln) amidotransferase subunit B, mitochondrial n=1 Tax=Cytospora mali TaxID=578113 RepID=A0A194VJE2_CYTMA|nr:Glutamyl-tRNA(Gln) amidotransferase subunit B, mitochondrial [Valsa mali]
MARIPVSELSRYLLRGKLHHPSCLRLTRSYHPALSPASARRHFSLSSPRLQQGELSTGPPSKDSSYHVPLRKQLKAEEKALKASGRKKTDNVSKQVVPGWELTVGIEIHAQLNTDRKLFSAATPPLPTDDPNTRVALFDLAMPGSQPIFQADALIPAVRAAIALNCDVQRLSRWDRKHYFWWDQPGGYQITQYHEPFAREGHITLYKRDGIAEEDGDAVTVGLQQIQMEQDTAKTLARPDGVQWVDFNRVGVPLIEIITKPDIHHPKTAAALVRKIQMYLNSVDACVSGMEAGGLRADVNVSVRRTDHALFNTMPLGQRTEIKNLSSFKAVEDAIIAERDRQIVVLTQGGAIAGETRGWSVGGTETTRLRGKEGEVDYRYMPDPDLGPVVISDGVVSHLRENLGVLPDAELDELVGEYGLRTKDAMSLMQLDGGGRLEYFYHVIQRLQTRLGDQWTKGCGVLAANWVLHELGRLTSERNASADGSVEDLGMTPSGECSRVPSEHLADIIYFLHTRRISSSVSKELLFAVFRGDLSSANPDGYSSIEQAIDKEGLWFQRLSKEQYEVLATDLLASERPMLMTKFAPHFSQGKKYPEGQLMYLVGKMMRSGPPQQMDAKDARETLTRLIEKMMLDLPKEKK